MRNHVCSAPFPIQQEASMAMAHFYLNIRDGEDLIRIPDSEAFETAQEARDTIVQAIRSFLRANPDNFDFDHKQIEVEDGATGHPVAVINFYDVAPHLAH
jgi:hypothetical protein